jgi:23S rRNA (pseudouridine1915-N3)-methyltransferase
LRLRLLAVGTRMPDWVAAGCAEYTKRIAGPLHFSLQEIEPSRRGASGATARAIEEEGERLLAATRAGEFVVALDERGREWSTRELADWLAQRMQQGQDVALLVGGADGLSAATLQRADQRWSLSRLTLPHPLVRVLVAEQLYRAHSLLHNHPYHRA